MNYRPDWSFKEQQPKKVETKKKAKNRKAKKKKKRWYTSKEDDFYSSYEWRSIRYRVLRTHGGKCMLCGATRSDGVKIHIDHIKPRSTHPHLELDFNNLQVLCEDCNIGKSNRDQIDWRTDAEKDAYDVPAHEMETLIAANNKI